jgi:sec-independent protein translocase protein TatC
MNFRKATEDLFENSKMTFGEHLEELRKVLVKCLMGVAVGCVFGFWFANPIVNLLNQPLREAMAEYNLKEASSAIVARNGYVDPELIPWLEKEKFVPRSLRIDPAELVKAIQTVVPDFAEKVNLDPYGFKTDSFRVDQLPQLCLQLAQQPSSNATKNAQAKLIWGKLLPGEKKTVNRIATQSTADAADVSAIVEIFNRVSLIPELSDAQEFASEIEPENTAFFSFFTEEKEKPLARMKEQLTKTGDPNLARRLNRALMTNTFSDYMAELKMDLVAIDVWESADFEPQSLGVSEPFFVWMKAGLFAGLILAGPWVFYQLWSFVASGLYPHEQKYVHIFLPISIGLFVAGVLLAFCFVFPPVLGFLFSFNQQMGIAPQMRINDWLGFVMFLPLGFGLAFQLPLVMLFMNRIGLFQVEDYLKKWRIAVMIIFVLAMILTPADPISMLLLAMPLTLLYFLGIAMCKWMPRNKNPFGEEERAYTSS